MPDRLEALVEPSDEMLAARVQQRDVAAFTLLYDRHAPTVYALAAHLLDAAIAEEIVQEAFLRLWRKAEQFDPIIGSFKGWFMTVARNHIWDVSRQRSHEARLTALDTLDQLLQETVDPTIDVAEEAWSRQQHDLILHALQQLPDAQRQAIYLAYFGGFSHSEIAQALGWPLGTVKKRIRLGMQKLRQYLHNDLQDDLQDHGHDDLPEWQEATESQDIR